MQFNVKMAEGTPPQFYIRFRTYQETKNGKTTYYCVMEGDRLSKTLYVGPSRTQAESVFTRETANYEEAS